jgi:crossover junction endodeoxyribonuclease RusA
MREQSDQLAPWRDSIVHAARLAMIDAREPGPFKGPCYVDVVFYFKRPATHFGTGRNRETLKPDAPDLAHGQRPDLDKLCRALGDALTTARVIGDDSQIAELTAHKCWDIEGNSMAVTVGRVVWVGAIK